MSTILVGELRENPEYLALVPRPSKEEYEALKEDIRQNGVKYPLLVNKQREIVDGYTRFQIAKELEIAKLPVMVRGFVDKNQEKYEVISLNLHRRHLNTAQRGELGLILEEIEKETAKERMVLGGKNKGSKNFYTPTNVKGKASDSAAQKVNISGMTLYKVRKIKEAAKEDPKIAKAWEKAKKTNGKVHPVYKLVKQKEVKESVKESPPLPVDKFDVILADPPWKYDFSKSTSRAIENQYPTMNIGDICRQKPPTNGNAILFLWTPAPKLREGLRVLKAWGFDYKTCMVWVKNKIGMGYYARSRHELLLIGVKGSMGVPNPENRFDSVIEAPRTEHSKKPDCVYEIIEKMYPQHKYLEMFARTERKGWGSWGNEI